ncbi:MAG: Cu(I)-responsive transcriptional regulator [Leptospiraceae bacterium]|nr:Cu(I)-responsive transcriptional regulator [Leptospiraceae bacterium]
MNIGEIAKKTGVNAKMIRHYESIGLIPKAIRLDSGYRIYGETDLHNLRFIKKARGLGFSLPEIKKLIGLWKNKKRSSGEVKKLALTHLNQLELKIRELNEIANTLRHLAHHCHGDDRPDCPILNELEELGSS